MRVDRLTGAPRKGGANKLLEDLGLTLFFDVIKNRPTTPFMCALVLVLQRVNSTNSTNFGVILRVPRCLGAKGLQVKW